MTLIISPLDNWVSSLEICLGISYIESHIFWFFVILIRRPLFRSRRCPRLLDFIPNLGLTFIFNLASAHLVSHLGHVLSSNQIRVLFDGHNVDILVQCIRSLPMTLSLSFFFLLQISFLRKLVEFLGLWVNFCLKSRICLSLDNLRLIDKIPACSSQIIAMRSLIVLRALLN